MNILHAKKWKIRLGKAGERTTCRMLRDAGFKVLLRNCRTNRAEVDIIARDGLSLVFVEVKTLYRRYDSKRELRPAARLRNAQKRRLYRAAISYLKDIGNPQLTFRFDLVEVIYNISGPYMIRHWKNHFGSEVLRRKRIDEFRI